MKMKKVLAFIVAASMVIGMAGCGNSSEVDGETAFDASYEISVVSREDGSGTRGAFIELVGVEQKDDEGNKVDYTTEDAIVVNSTSGVMTTVAGDEYAIGYVSLGSLDDTVKALKVEGVEATEANIKSGDYVVARPFNIATKEEVSEVAQDFINFILSEEGQAVVSENKYISLDGAASFEGTSPAGKIVVAGSSSVTPLMEKLKEAYLTINPNAEIEMQTNDSTTGMNWTIEGTCDIGMASRELKEEELAQGLVGTVIATDGIAIVVNQENPLEDITKEQIKTIYVGEVLTWDEITE